MKILNETSHAKNLRSACTTHNCLDNTISQKWSKLKQISSLSMTGAWSWHDYNDWWGGRTYSYPVPRLVFPLLAPQILLLTRTREISGIILLETEIVWNLIPTSGYELVKLDTSAIGRPSFSPVFSFRLLHEDTDVSKKSLCPEGAVQWEKCSRVGSILQVEFRELSVGAREMSRGSRRAPYSPWQREIGWRLLAQVASHSKTTSPAEFQIHNCVACVLFTLRSIHLVSSGSLCPFCSCFDQTTCKQIKHSHWRAKRRPWANRHCFVSPRFTTHILVCWWDECYDNRRNRPDYEDILGYARQYAFHRSSFMKK